MDFIGKIMLGFASIKTLGVNGGFVQEWTGRPTSGTLQSMKNLISVILLP